MRKVIFLMTALCLNCGVVKSQVSDAVIATLQHGDSLQTFYGYGAFSDAVSAANDGDVIRLSAGTFNLADIRKSLTVIGAGFINDSINNIYATNLYAWGSSNFWILADNCKFEGLSIQKQTIIDEYGRNIEFVKCRFGSRLLFNDTTENVTLRQCVVTYDSNPEGYSLNLYSSPHTNLCIIGSYILDGSSYRDTGETIYLDHCILPKPLERSATYTNCIIGGTFEDGITNVVRNCVLFDEEPEITTTGYVNYYSFDYDDIFEEEMDDLWWDDEKTFKVKADLDTTDDTEIGMYGGDYPYNPTPSVPQITDFTLDDSDITNGTLKVSVTAEAQTEN